MEKPSWEDSDWFFKNSAKIYEQYIGKVVAIYGKRVIAHENNLDRLLTHLRENGYNLKKTIIFVLDEKEMIPVCV